MSYIKDHRRRPATQYLDPEAAIQKANRIVDEANNHIADTLAAVRAQAQAEIDRIRAEANSLVEFWQRQAEEMGHELARADREIRRLRGELTQRKEQPPLPKAGNRRKGRKKGRQWEEG